MARPQQNSVLYFRHFTHLEDVTAIRILWKRFKKDGFVFYFRTREILGYSDGHFLDLRNPEVWYDYLGEIDIDEVSTRKMIDLLVEIGEIDRELWDFGIIWWQSYVDDLFEVYDNRKRELPQKPVITDNNDVITPNYPVSTAKNGVSAGERRGEGRRGKGRGGTSNKKKGTKVQKKSNSRERGIGKSTLSTVDGKGKKEKVNPSIRKVERFLEEHRGLQAGKEKGIKSPSPELEREYIQLMLSQGFTVKEICNCYSDYKEGIRISNKPPDNYWVDKFLDMKSLYRQITDWRKKKTRIRSEFEQKYGHLVGR